MNFDLPHITFPELFITDARSKQRVWKIWINGDEIHKEYGLVDGKKIHNITQQKTVNAGKANEQNPHHHAISVAKSEWIKKIDEGYKALNIDTLEPHVRDYFSNALTRKQQAGGRNIDVFKNNDIEQRPNIVIQEHATIEPIVELTQENKISPLQTEEISSTQENKISPTAQTNEISSPQVKSNGKSDAQAKAIFKLPMLAHQFEPDNVNNKKYLDFNKGVFIDPKLDGVRYIANFVNNQVILTSRTGKQFPHMNHIRDELKNIFHHHPTVYFDGELYLHEAADENWRFEFITSAGSVSRKIPHSQENIMEYHIFDIVDEKLKQNERFKFLEQVKQEFPNMMKIKFVPHTLVHSWEEAKSIYDRCIADKYEGIMLKAFDALYKIGKRTMFVQKYKHIETSEAVIVGGKEGEGIDKGKIIWRCKFENSPEFDARPVGTLQKREQQFNEFVEHPENFIGKRITVKYQELTNTNAPRQPIALDFVECTEIRDYE